MGISSILTKTIPMGLSIMETAIGITPTTTKIIISSGNTTTTSRATSSSKGNKTTVERTQTTPWGTRYARELYLNSVGVVFRFKAPLPR